jgi:17beta-estradiol 17-dehydrogenase / very-long-chain 3-oxoacyl-CoA reductase
MNTEFPKLFSDNNDDETRSIVDVNCTSLVLLTRAVLGTMITRTTKSAVINISSLFGQTGAPLLSVYSGTKSFIDSFSGSLGAELESVAPQVSVFCSLPGFVVSNMSKIRRTSLTVISPDMCAESVLGQVAGGVLRISAPHWSHNIIGWILIDILPARLRLWLLGKINTATNKAALRKRETQGTKRD